MKPSRALALLLLLSAPFLAPTTHAQEANLLAFEANVDRTLIVFPVGSQGTFTLTVHDQSMDSANPLQPGGTPGTPGVFPHTIRFEVNPVEEKPGWNINPPSGLTTRSGQTRDYVFRISASPTASDPFYPANITVVMTSGNMEARRVVDVVGYTPGLDGFNGQIGNTYQLKPRDIADVPVRVTNVGLYPRYFELEVTGNPCGLDVVPPGTTLVPGRSSTETIVTVRAPASKPYYFSDNCPVDLQLSPQDNPQMTQALILVTQVEGWALNPMWFFHAAWILLLLLLLILLAKRRKERIEEEILGKPQKPWTIPVEVVYLKHLKAKDERAWYVVRHHLMEEEYASSLLWYKSYKKATKGTRRKEAVVLRQERRHERWKAAWRKDIAKPVRQADRYEAKLQRKLDRKARKAHRRQVRKWRILTAKMRKAHAKQEERALQKWAKASRRAERKGLAAPPKPALADPDYPPEPVLEPRPLAEHRWARKAARYRARMVKREGDLEVRFERAEARRHRKMERKVRRVARQLDDPDFVAEHPMLGERPAPK